VPEQYIKTDQQDQSWVIVDVDHEQKAVAAGPSSENQLDVKLGWGEKKVTVFRYCWKVQGCGKCDSDECRKWAREQAEEKDIARKT